MKVIEILHAWGRILAGRRPSMSIEITRECPLRCPGCYAYGDAHLGEGGPNLRSVADYKGQELVSRVLQLVDEHKPLHLSIVGGDPLVRYREVDELLPAITGRGIHVQLVTSAFREVPTRWTALPRTNVVVSVDGLQPEHDLRRKPATYERILKSLAGQEKTISIHCTITAQMVRRTGYLREFVEFWSARPEPKRIWFSMYTPQLGEVSNEKIPWELRESAVERLLKLAADYPLVDLHSSAIRNFLKPPQSPDQCTFARTTHTISADLKTKITPCQFGGNPDCANCGCVASVALHAIANHKVFGTFRTGDIFDKSFAFGERIARLRERPVAVERNPLPILNQSGAGDTEAAESAEIA